MLEDLYYPVTPSGRQVPGSIPKTSGTTAAQSAYNAKQSEVREVRIVNTNFIDGDIFMTLTYADGCPDRPKNDDEAAAKMQRYIRRVKRWRSASGEGAMKYAYSIHVKIRKSGKYKGEPMYHYHLFMSKMDRNAAERLWKDGAQVDAKSFDPWAYGQEAAARYMARGAKPKKDPEEGDEELLDRSGRRRFACSRNCTKPEIPKKQKRMNISKRKAEEMATAHIDDAAYWQGKVPEGYVYRSMDYILNPWNGMYYWRVTYRRLPEWNTKKKRKEKRTHDT